MISRVEAARPDLIANRDDAKVRLRSESRLGDEWCAT
jgi:hypothetical protein